ncbi:MAG TPA: alpha/beta hydrolase [Hyphomicrobium sp.]|nr:alpha/beta hydrolase [Hyphomicrobium sp.]
MTAIVACGLLAACSEMPKIGKTAEDQSRPAEKAQIGAPTAKPTAEPVPEASAPKASAPGSEASAPSEAEQQGQASDKDEAQPQINDDYRKKESGGTHEDANTAEAPPPAEPAPVGASPPATDQEVTAPATAQPPPPPVAAAPPPAAPAAAARAAIEADPNKKYKVVPVFYGTDRAIEPDPTRLQFGSERGHKLQLGRALITVPSSHEVPHIERPRVIEIPYFKIKIYAEKEDPDKHFTVQEITSLTEDQMLALVRDQLAKSATFKNHAFVFIHGFNTSFDCALYRTAQIAYDLGFDGVPFLYSWPSGGNVASYTYDHGSVEQAEPMLAEFLDMVIQKSGAKSISLIAHSMGNELLLRVLERLKPKIPKGVVISQVILAAPDVDRDKFNIIAREITNFARGVTLYAASNDRALGYSQRFWGGVPRAGDIPRDGPLIIPGVDTIDVTAVSTDALGLNHSGYAENPALLDDVKALVEFGIRPPNKRLKSILAVESPAGTYWRFQTIN